MGNSSPTNQKRLIALTLLLFAICLFGWLPRIGVASGEEIPPPSPAGVQTRSEGAGGYTLTPTPAKSLKTRSGALEGIIPSATPTPLPTASPTPSPSLTPTEEPVVDPVSLLSDEELKMLYRQGLSECEVLGGEARDDCTKGVTSTVFARIALDQKMDGTWSLSDGTIWGTMSIYSGDFPQFTPWDWDTEYCDRNPGFRLCGGKQDLTPYIAPVHAALRGDGGSCPGYFYYGHERPPNLTTACAITSGQRTMYFHMGWGWHGLLDPGEWMDGLPKGE